MNRQNSGFCINITKSRRKAAFLLKQWLVLILNAHLHLVLNNDYFSFILICLNTHHSPDRKSNHWKSMSEIHTKYHGNVCRNLISDTDELIRRDLLEKPDFEKPLTTVYSVSKKKTSILK